MIEKLKKSKRHKKICRGCGVEFETNRKVAKFHTLGCYHLYNKDENHPMFGKHHLKEYRKKISESNKGREVWNKGKKGVQIAYNKGRRKYKKTCKNCGIEFRTSKKDKKFHTRECFYLYNRGENSCNFGKSFVAWNKDKKCPQISAGLGEYYKKKHGFIPIEKVLEMYFQKKILIREIANHFKVGETKIANLIKKSGNKLKTISESKLKYSCNWEYFENIDSPDKAYWLGFIAADGNVCIAKYTKNGKCHFNFRVQLAQAEKNHLEKFKFSINSNHLVRLARKKTQFHKNLYFLLITSDKMFNDLVKCNIVPRKSLILEYPNNLKDNLQRHFIRGYFDGDGCVSVCKRGYISVEIVSGSFLFLEKMCNILNRQLNLNVKLKQERKSLFRIRITSIKKVTKFFHYFYDNVSSDVYMDRKYDKFIEYFKLKGIDV